jgi:hypothetical protein
MKKVSVLLIKTHEGTTCIIEQNDNNWLSILKKTIKEYLATRYIPDRDSVISFCDQALCLRKLQVLVNTFINNLYPFSWIITTSTLPDFNKIDIQEFLLEPIPDPNAPEPLIIDSLEPIPEPIEAETVHAPSSYEPDIVPSSYEPDIVPSSYEPEAVFEVTRRNTKIHQLKEQLRKKRIEELHAQLEALKSDPDSINEVNEVVGLPTAPLDIPTAPLEVVSVLDPCE